MARIARVVAPGYPHHVVQRGNRRQTTFFGEHDFRFYLGLLFEYCQKYGVEIWTYCLMPNHVHLIAVPFETESLRATVAEVHRRYTIMINEREGWRGYLWQGRFASYVMDSSYLLAATRYIELNPVRAKLSSTPEDYKWSSARNHLLGAPDQLANFREINALAPDWRKFRLQTPEPHEVERLKAHCSTGRPLGGNDFISELEKSTGRVLAKRMPGRKPQRQI